MNSKIRNINKQLLSDNWYTLNKYTYDFESKDGQWEQHSRESYDRGNGATVLLYNPQHKTIILTRQFRMPTYVNGNVDGMLIETCAGLLEGDEPEVCVKKEAEEETGYRISKVEKVFEAYMSPGAVTEVISFFIAEYDHTMKVSDGGGLAQEQENIEVLEFSFDEAFKMIHTGDIIDAKTIMLLQHVKLMQLCG